VGIERAPSLNRVTREGSSLSTKVVRRPIKSNDYPTLGRPDAVKVKLKACLVPCLHMEPTKGVSRGGLGKNGQGVAEFLSGTQGRDIRNV